MKDFRAWMNPAKVSSGRRIGGKEPKRKKVTQSWTKPAQAVEFELDEPEC